MPLLFAPGGSVYSRCPNVCQVSWLACVPQRVVVQTLTRCPVSQGPLVCNCCRHTAPCVFASFCSACLEFAGEAVLYFDLGAAIISQLEGSYLAPGTKLADDVRVHGALITAGVYALLASLVGFIAVIRKSLRAATIFFILQVINTVFAVAIMLIILFVGT